MDSPILRPVLEQLETERLILRCPRAGDGEAVHAAVVESLVDLRRWPSSLPWAMFEPSVAASETFCRESQASFIKRSSLVYLLFAKDGGGYVGSSSLHNIDWSVPKFEVGYWCRSSRQRQGLISEAVKALKDYAMAEPGARRVQCVTDEQNLSSRSVCERAGFVLEGVLRNERRAPDGALRNTCVYAHVR